MNSIRFAAVFAASLRPRQAQVNPRVFHILSRPQPKPCALQRRVFSGAATRPAVAQEVSTGDESRPLPQETQEPAGREGTEETVIEDGEHTYTRKEINHEFSFTKQRSEFRCAMRTVPHPIAIVTTQPPTAEDDELAVVGATVSSFNTVSLHPDLVVSFNLTRDSATYRTILDSKHFCVSFPINNQPGQDLARRFAQGNDTPPFHPDLVPGVRGLNWTDLAPAPASGMKQYPPAVCLKDRDLPTEDAGLAFAFLCEYENSLPVGDHVIVTGRLIPHQLRSSKKYGWGSSEKYGGAFSTSHTTLIYAHQAWGNPDNINSVGLDGMWKFEDAFRRVALETSDPTKLESIRAHYENSLVTIQNARLHRQNQTLSIPRRSVLRASEMPSTRLDQFETYWKERLAAVDKIANGKSSEGGDKPEEVEISGWQNLLIRKKMLLSDQELKKEESLYMSRFERLNAQEKKVGKSQHSTTDATTFQHAGAEHDTPSDPARMTELATHIQDRLNVIREAKRRKRAVNPSIQVNKMNKIQVTRFLESKRALGYDALKKGYRRDEFQIQEARLSLLEMENRPDSSAEAIKKLKDRIDYYTETRGLIARLLVERITKADPAELNAMIRMPLHGMESPPPTPAPPTSKPKVRKLKVPKKVNYLSGDRDEEGNWTFGAKNRVRTTHKPKEAGNPQKAGTIDNDQGDDMTKQELEEMHASQVAARHTSDQGRRHGDVRDEHGDDALVMKHFEDEEIPTWPNPEKQE